MARSLNLMTRLSVEKLEKSRKNLKILERKRNFCLKFPHLGHLVSATAAVWLASQIDQNISRSSTNVIQRRRYNKTFISRHAGTCYVQFHRVTKYSPTKTCWRNTSKWIIPKSIRPSNRRRLNELLPANTIVTLKVATTISTMRMYVKFFCSMFCCCNGS